MMRGPDSNRLRFSDVSSGVGSTLGEGCPCGLSRRRAPQRYHGAAGRQSLPKRWRRVMQIRKALEPHADVGRVEDQ